MLWIFVAGDGIIGRIMSFSENVTIFLYFHVFFIIVLEDVLKTHVLKTL